MSIPAVTRDQRLKSKDNDDDDDAKEREKENYSLRIRSSICSGDETTNERQDARTGTGRNEPGIRKQFQKRRKRRRHRRRVTMTYTLSQSR